MEKKMKNFYMFTILAPVYTFLNMIVFLILRSNQVTYDSPETILVMYFSLFLIVVSAMLSFINLKLSKFASERLKVISNISFYLTLLLLLMLVAFVFYSK